MIESGFGHVKNLSTNTTEAEGADLWLVEREGVFHANLKRDKYSGSSGCFKENARPEHTGYILHK